MDETIPKEIALQLCEEIREDNAHKKFGSGKMMCWGCIKATKDNVEGRCVFANELNRGCYQVNDRYDKIYKKRK